MHFPRLFRLALFVLLSASSASAQDATDFEATNMPPVPEKKRTFSTELLDAEGLTRFHITSRGMFSDGRKAFSSASSWAFEARAHVHLAGRVALAAAIPIGAMVRDETGSHAFFGNLALGFSAGGALSDESSGPQFFLTGGADIYLPTSPDRGQELARSDSVIAAMRTYEPQLYIPRLASLRARGNLSLVAGAFTGELELGLIPAVRFSSEENQYSLLFSFAARGNVRATEALDVFLEIGNTRQLTGPGAIEPPPMITPGVRLHLAKAFAPAVFASFNVLETSAVIFGIDLASALARPKESKRARALRDTDSFLEGVEHEEHNRDDQF